MIPVFHYQIFGDFRGVLRSFSLGSFAENLSINFLNKKFLLLISRREVQNSFTALNLIKVENICRVFAHSERKFIWPCKNTTVIKEILSIYRHSPSFKRTKNYSRYFNSPINFPQKRLFNAINLIFKLKAYYHLISFLNKLNSASSLQIMSFKRRAFEDNLLSFIKILTRVNKANGTCNRT